MKEALTSPYNRIVFRETFNSEQSVRSNGGVPTAVTISKGIGSFNGTTSYIKYNKNLNGVYSVRIKSKNLNPSSSCTYIDFRNSSGTGVGYLTGGNLNLGASSGTVYVNGIAKNTVNTSSSDIVITGITINCFEIFLNTRYSLANYLDSDIELLEIYQGTLTYSEIKNLYDNDWNKEFISSNLLLDYDSTNGYITDRTGKNTLTPTNVTIKKTGIYYGSEFNGVDSTLITDSTDPTIWQSGFTVVAWIKPRGWGELNYGRILDVSNSAAGKDGFNFCINNLNSSLFCNINEVGATRSGINSINIGSWQFVVLTVSSDSYINFYKGDIDVAPTLSGLANRTSGLITSITTTNPVTIGNRSTATDSTFNGNIPMLTVYKGILSLEQLTQIWSSTRGKI